MFVMPVVPGRPPVLTVLVVLLPLVPPVVLPVVLLVVLSMLIRRGVHAHVFAAKSIAAPGRA